AAATGATSPGVARTGAAAGSGAGTAPGGAGAGVALRTTAAAAGAAGAAGAARATRAAGASALAALLRAGARLLQLRDPLGMRAQARKHFLGQRAASPVLAQFAFVEPDRVAVALGHVLEPGLVVGFALQPV